MRVIKFLPLLMIAMACDDAVPSYDKYTDPSANFLSRKARTMETDGLKLMFPENSVDEPVQILPRVVTEGFPEVVVTNDGSVVLPSSALVLTPMNLEFNTTVQCEWSGSGNIYRVSSNEDLENGNNWTMVTSDYDDGFSLFSFERFGIFIETSDPSKKVLYVGSGDYTDRELNAKEPVYDVSTDRYIVTILQTLFAPRTFLLFAEEPQPLKTYQVFDSYNSAAANTDPDFVEVLADYCPDLCSTKYRAVQGEITYSMELVTPKLLFNKVLLKRTSDGYPIEYNGYQLLDN
jgi:hypothetical protein